MRLLNILLFFSSIGIPFYGVREIAKIKFDTKKRSNLVVELVFIQLSLSIFYSVIFFLIHFFIPSLKSEFALVKIAIITIISNSFLIEWFYQGIENFAYITKRAIILKILSLISILIFVRHSNDHNIYYLILALATFANAIFNFSNFYKRHFQKFNFFSLQLKDHLRPLLILFSINISLSIYTVLDTIILGLFTDPGNVSFYNVPLRLVKVFWMVIGGIGTVLIPRMSTLFIQNDNISISQLMTKSINIVLLLTLPFCFFCICFPSEILFIISGNKYLEASNALRILSIVPLIIGICNIFGAQYLLPIGKENKVLYATICGLVVSLLINFLLIPHIKFLGSAIACVMSELTVCLYVFFSTRKLVKITVDYLLILQILCSILLCYFGKMVIGIFINHWLIAYTFIVYIIALILLQLIFKNEFLFSLISLKKTRSNEN